MNKNWTKWIKASVVKHFVDALSQYVVFIEGQKRNTNNEVVLLELRIDGPDIVELSKDYFRLYIEVNILIQVTMNDINIYKMDVVAGDVAAAFTGLTIYKYGSESFDDETVVGCMKLMTATGPKDKEGIIVSHFGQIDKSVALMQSTVEGHYELFLTE